MEFTGDGKLDILSGCYSDHDPMAGIFWLLAGKGDGSVASAEQIKGRDGKPLIIPAGEGENGVIRSICTQPLAHDWDGDGDLDLLSGNFEGGYFLFRNEGTKAKASFNPKPEEIMSATGKPLKIEGAHSGAQLVDWDGDGDLDLITGSSSGGAAWAENVGERKGEPKFKPMEMLVAGSLHDYEAVPPEKAALPEMPGQNSRVFAVDVNGDGKLDLLIGDSADMNSRAKGVSEAEFQTRSAAWNKEMEEVQEGKLPPEKMSEAYGRIWEKRKEFVIERQSGFVWLLVRK